MLDKKMILLVDADENTRIKTKDLMEKENAIILQASDGKKALEIYNNQSNKIDLMIIDISLPEYDGWTVCREVRKKSDLPIIILTARCEDFDEVYGLEIGADDYLRKPVNPTVLLARIQSIFRKNSRNNEKKHCFTNLEINDAFHRVKVCDLEVNLSPKEYSILLILVENNGRIVSREELLRKVWGYYYYGGLRTVDTHINRLRIKLGQGGNGIQTIRGFGYRFEDYGNQNKFRYKV